MGDLLLTDGEKSRPRASVPAVEAAPAASRLTLLVCALAALLEGLDNQSMGVAAPRLMPEFGLTPSLASFMLSAAPFGLMLGAAIGGRIADRRGYAWTLTVSLLLLGSCSLLTAVSVGAKSLFVARLLTGLGLGGAMPNFIALASEASSSAKRVTSVTVVMAAMPLGGLLAGLVALGQTIGWGWRSIFYVGGIAPLLLAPMVRWVLPSTSTLRKARADEPRPEAMQGIFRVLFGSERGLTTSALWGGFFFTQLVLLLLLNWLPSLFVGLGFSHGEASLASMCFNASGALGSVFLARLHAGRGRRLWVILTYVGMAACLSVLPNVGRGFLLAVTVCALAGVFTIGAQLILFALAPLYYERAIRGTGVGSAVAVGRLGSVVGPLYAGALLAAGGSSGTVLHGIVPFVLLGGASALALTWRPVCRD